MFSRTGTSAERPRASRLTRRLTAALALTVLLAAMIGVAGFRTVARDGTERVRSAPFVWRIAAERIRRDAPTPAMYAVYAASLAATLAGSFLLLWLAAASGSDDGDDAAEGSTALAAFRRGAAAFPRRSSVSRRAARTCVAAMLVLAGFAAWRMGLFAPMRVEGVANTFASFDHPFHIARAETLVRSLRQGHALRWIASHQGGYPAEFYPFGFATFEAALWALGAGRVPVPVVHRVAVIVLFLAPGLLFYAMARRDRWPPIVGLAAFALHVCVPGDMWAGGYGELVLVGLVANVSAALAVVVSMVAASDAFAGGRRRSMAIAAAAAAAAIWCNPRNAIALAICVAAAWAVGASRSRWTRRTGQLAAIAAVAALAAAPELISLIRFQHLYYFIRYTGYATSLDFVAASIDAVSLPAFVLAVIAVGAAPLVDREHVITRTVAAALVAYAAMTLVFTFAAGSFIQQLETTRLMPVQRLLTIYAAAVGLHLLVSAALTRARLPTGAPIAAQLAVVAAVIVVFVGPRRLMPYWSRGLYAVEWSGVPAMANFQQVLTVADHEAPPGTAVLVVGTAMGGHQQLWAPVRNERLYFYDEWMWYWQRKHRGPYNPLRTSKYAPDRLDEVFAREYLDRHAIGAVVVAAAEQPMADAAPPLRRVFGGTFGVYAVADPVRIVTLGGRAPDSLTIENESIISEGTSPGGDAVVRRNWFPRWRAQVNERPVPIVETDDGYMRVPIPAGRVRLSLTYALQPADVAARAAGIIGGLALIGMAIPRPRRGALSRVASGAGAVAGR